LQELQLNGDYARTFLQLQHAALAGVKAAALDRDDRRLSSARAFARAPARTLQLLLNAHSQLGVSAPEVALMGLGYGRCAAQHMPKACLHGVWKLLVGVANCRNG
jgi:hypothetical protein